MSRAATENATTILVGVVRSKRGDRDKVPQARASLSSNFRTVCLFLSDFSEVHSECAREGGEVESGRPVL